MIEVLERIRRLQAQRRLEDLIEGAADARITCEPGLSLARISR